MLWTRVLVVFIVFLSGQCFEWPHKRDPHKEPQNSSDVFSRGVYGQLPPEDSQAIASNPPNAGSTLSSAVDTTSAAHNRTTHPVSHTTDTQTVEYWPTSDQKDIKKPARSAQNKDKSSKIVYYLIAFVVLLLAIIGLIWATIFFQSIRKSKKSQNKVTDEPVTEGPLDPRYGKLDPNLNLTLRIANPSVAHLDQELDQHNNPSNKPHKP